VFATTGQRADKDTIVVDPGFHAQAVAKQGAAAYRTRWVYRQHANALAALAPDPDQSRSEGRLARPRRPGDANQL
jgi:hypothetical protein